MLFWGSAKPSFGWYKVTLNIYEATTTKIHGQGAPKLGTLLRSLRFRTKQVIKVMRAKDKGDKKTDSNKYK